MTTKTRPDSPCRGFCTTALGDDVCKFCGRTFEEVTQWIVMTDTEKKAVWVRLKREGWLDNVGKNNVCMGRQCRV